MASSNATGVRRRVQPPPTASGSSPAPKSILKQPKQSQPLPPTTNAPFSLKTWTVIYLLFISHVFAAFYSPIQDCDEVFNYWEPMHYLLHQFGFQTWEYSPDFAIRSWLYPGMHAVAALPARLIPVTSSGKSAEFYFTRIVLAGVCALCESRLFSKIATTLNPRIAITFLIVMASSPGMFHASVALLPSSFAMYFVMLGIAAFMDWRGGLRTAQGIWCFGIAATLGWPFAAAMSLPFLFEESIFALMNDRQGKADFMGRVLDGVTRSLIVLALQTAIDTFFYKRLKIVPWNIVAYNVLSSKGPDLYGTEPWHFYIRNLFLNFHLWFILALAAMPLLVMQHLTKAKGAMKATWTRGIIITAPFYLWLAIFTLQPHKEERFMYPAYPALAVNAAVSLHIILANFGSTDPKDFVSKIPQKLRLAGVLAFLTAAMALSLFRTLGLSFAYSAPLSIYKPLHQPGMVHSSDTVCLGKEWYRFPSHFLLPADVQAKFVRSEFAGLLPGEFSQASQGFGFYSGAWLVPSGMNDENQEDPGKYTDIKHCSYLVDSELPSTQVTALEPSYIGNVDAWEKVQCLPFLDAASTGIIGRLGWVPDLPFIPASLKPVYGEYCLLKRKKKQTPGRRMDGIPSIDNLQ